MSVIPSTLALTHNFGQLSLTLGSKFALCLLRLAFLRDRLEGAKRSAYRLGIAVLVCFVTAVLTHVLAG